MNEKIIRLVTGLSLATIKVLTSRDNGIGKVVENKEGFEALHRIRKTIINENVHLHLKDKELELRDRSFLGALTDHNIDNNDYGEMAVRLADILEGELLHVKDKFIPTVNNIVSLIEDRLAQTPTANIQNKYTVKYIDTLSIATMLKESELNGTFTTPDIGGLSFKFDAVDSYATLRGYLMTGNSIADSAIAELLATQTEDHWLDVYNTVFTNLSPRNSYLESFQSERLPRLHESIFLYLVIRTFSVKVPFVITGNVSEVKFTINTLKEYFSSIVSTNLKLMDAMISTKSLIISNKDDVITINKSLMADLDVDTVIGAAIEGVTSYDQILAKRDMYKEIYKSTNELYIMAANKLQADEKKKIIMEIFDVEIPKYSGSYDRRNVSEYIYSKDNEKLANLHKIVGKSILVAQYNEDGNISYIIERMKIYIKMFDKDETDFAAVAEYIALELVSKYIVNVHIHIKD